MRRPWLLAAVLAAAAVGIAAFALIQDNSSEPELTAAGFPETPQGRKPLIFDIGSMIYLPDADRARAIRQIQELGANAIRVPILWNVAAAGGRPDHAADPRDPGYDFTPYDKTVAEATKDGLRVLLMPTGPAPAWASRPGGGGIVDPDPDQFGLFVSALARRYDGRFLPAHAAEPLPKPSIWTIWNEPNLSTFLRPQRKRGIPYSPLLYRRLYLAGQDAIHTQDPAAPILIGETAPTGGEQSVDPLTFTRQTLCLNGDFDELPHCPKPEAKINAVGWSTHPYPLVGEAPYQTAPNPHFVTMSSLSGLEATLGGAHDAGAIPDNFPIYITEFGIQSHPDPNAVSLEQQAADIGIAEHFAYADPNVVTFGQYLLQDDSPEALPGVPYAGFESGLKTFDGHKKPSYEAFRLPLALQRLGDNSVALWGIVQPYPRQTQVKIRYKNPGRPVKTLQTVNTDDVGIYSTTYGNSPGRRWQAVWQSPLDGHVYRSPWVRSYEYVQPSVG